MKTNINEEGVIIDVRPAEMYMDGHIPGAVSIPYDIFSTEVGKVLPVKDVAITVYCESGYNAGECSKELKELGYTNVVDFGSIENYDGPLEIPDQD